MLSASCPGSRRKVVFGDGPAARVVGTVNRRFKEVWENRSLVFPHLRQFPQRLAPTPVRSIGRHSRRPSRPPHPHRRLPSGHFHSEDVLKLKLGLAISSQEDGKWRSP